LFLNRYIADRKNNILLLILQKSWEQRKEGAFLNEPLEDLLPRKILGQIKNPTLIPRN